MALKAPKIDLHTAPYIRKAPTVPQIMRNVVYALLPIATFSVYLFGISALALIITSTAACVASEHFFCWIADKKSSLPDFSAVITGILLALTLPPGFPLWMSAVGAFVAIGLGKMLFGGLGFNLFNPALVGRAFLQAAFPVAITTWTPVYVSDRFVEFIPSTLALPFMRPESTAAWITQVAIDGFSGATPLALMKFQQIITDSSSLFFGTTAGSTGETSSLLILLCGAYLALRNMLDWRIPVAVILGAAVTAQIFHWLDPHAPNALFMVLSGGLMLGAVFMATDMVSSPVTPLGVFIFGALIGFLTVLIRLYGALTEAVMYAILFANALTPIIDTCTQPKIYGARKVGKDSK